MLSTTPHLPQELVDHIVDHLHDDLMTLHSCSLVARAWLPSSRLHIFSKISLKVTPLNPLNPTDLCRRLHQLLVSSPSIISNIHELEVCEGAPGTSSPQSGTHSRSTTWVTTERTFPPLLRMLTHLKRLEFGAKSVLHWSTLPETLQSAICHVFALPSLTYIRLISWTFPNYAGLAELLACCQNLTGLALSSTRVCTDAGDFDTPNIDYTHPLADELDLHLPTDEEQAATLPPRRCRLEFLTLDYVDFGYLGYWLLSPRSTVEVSSLRELRVAHFYDITAVERLLAATGSSLEHFHLKPGSWDVHTFDLALNPGLRSLRLTLEDPETALAWATALVQRISTLPPVFERLAVELYTDPKLLTGGWAALDALLVRPELAALRHVDIGLFAAPTHAEFARVRAELPRVRARGILRLYQLGIKSQRSSTQLMPRISRYEYN